MPPGNAAPPAGKAPEGTGGLFRPVVTFAHGLHRLAAAARRRWRETPAERRGPLVFLVASVVLTLALVPYGPALALAALVGAAFWQGHRHTRPASEHLGAGRERRLCALYEALVPYFATPSAASAVPAPATGPAGAPMWQYGEPPGGLYVPGGTWEKAFPCHAFDADGRLCRLLIRYPAHFMDGEQAARAAVERVVHAKSGRGREYRFTWDEEGNELTVTVLSPLLTGIAAQRFRTAPDETVLGFTDPADELGTPSVVEGAEGPDLPAVVWRTGPRCAAPHLLAVGRPGSGTSTLLRFLALQALAHGDVLIADGGGTGEYACLRGRQGVLAVESGLTGARAALEWAAHETQRRLLATGRARQAGHPPPQDIGRPLWVLLDRPGTLADLATAEGRPDPQELLTVPLRQGRAARVTVVVAEQLDALDRLAETVRQYTRARVLLGPAPPGQLDAVLGPAPHTTVPAHMPPGRGYARLGGGPVLRLQVPATPDPYDETATAEHRQAVMDLLPGRTATGAAPAPEPPAPRTPVSRQASGVWPFPAGGSPFGGSPPGRYPHS